MILGKLLISNILILIVSTRLALGMKGASIVKEVLEKHRSLAENKLGDLYFPKSSCYFSTGPIKGKKNIALGPIPLEHNIFEYGFFGSNFPRVASAYIKLNKKCYFRVNVIKKNLKKPVLQYQICLKSKLNCSRVYAKYTYQSLDEDECYFFSFGVGDDMKIYYGISIGCSAPSTNVFQPGIYTKIKDKNCQYEAKSKFKAELRLEKDRNSKYEGIVLLLPCNPGGYVVDYKTGKLAADDYYNHTFWYSASKPGLGYNFVVQKFFKGDKNITFPTKKYSDKDVKNKIPVYMLKGVQVKLEDESSSEIKEKKDKPGKKNKGKNSNKESPIGRSLLEDSHPKRGKTKKKDKKKTKKDGRVFKISSEDSEENSDEDFDAKYLLNLLLTNYSALIEEHPIFVIKFK